MVGLPGHHIHSGCTTVRKHCFSCHVSSPENVFIHRLYSILCKDTGTGTISKLVRYMDSCLPDDKLGLPVGLCPLNCMRLELPLLMITIINQLQCCRKTYPCLGKSLPCAFRFDYAQNASVHETCPNYDPKLTALPRPYSNCLNPSALSQISLKFLPT